MDLEDSCEWKERNHCDLKEFLAKFLVLDNAIRGQELRRRNRDEKKKHVIETLIISKYNLLSLKEETYFSKMREGFKI